MSKDSDLISFVSANKTVEIRSFLAGDVYWLNQSIEMVLRSFLAELSCEGEPKDDSEWIALMKYYVQITADVIPRDRHPSIPIIMKESTFCDLYRTGRRIFPEFLNERHNASLPGLSIGDKQDVLNRWNVFETGLKPFLPLLPSVFAEPNHAADVKTALRKAMTTFQSHQAEFHRSDVEEIQTLVSEFGANISLVTKVSVGSPPGSHEVSEEPSEVRQIRRGERFFLCDRT